MFDFRGIPPLCILLPYHRRDFRFYDWLLFQHPVHYNVAIYGICRYLPERRVPPLLPDPLQSEVDGDFRCGLDGVHVRGNRASGQGGNPFVLFEFYYFLFQHQELQAGIPQGNTQEAGLSAAEGSEQASVRYLRAHGGRRCGIGISVLLKMWWQLWILPGSFIYPSAQEKELMTGVAYQKDARQLLICCYCC